MCPLVRIPRQLAPTMGPKVSVVTFRAGTRGRIGETITIGQPHHYNNATFIYDDTSWVPANDDLITTHIMPIGAVDIFIVFTPAAFGFSKVGGIQAPTHLPVYQEETPQEDGSDLAFSKEPADSDLHFVGAIISEIPSQDDNNKPDSILQELDVENKSEAGSASTVFMEEEVYIEGDTDSGDNSSSMFHEKVLD